MFSLFKKGLERVSNSIVATLTKLGDRPDAQTLDKLEQTLLEADLGPMATEAIINELSAQRQQGRPTVEVLKECLRKRLAGVEKPFIPATGTQTVLIVGINGVGKTTTVAKLAYWAKAAGRRPLIASADTFRAAANEQLAIGAQKAGVALIESRTGADPAAVAFDALKATQARNNDMLIIDTAGRLHTKEKLMDELGKIDRALKKIDPSAPQHRLLVLDATLGLNTLAQAKAFAEAISLTGLIVTKLDGSAKAGAIVPLYEELRLPVYFVGLGEEIDELEEFSTAKYLDGLLG